MARNLRDFLTRGGIFHMPKLISCVCCFLFYNHIFKLSHIIQTQQNIFFSHSSTTSHREIITIEFLWRKKNTSHNLSVSRDSSTVSQFNENIIFHSHSHSRHVRENDDECVIKNSNWFDSLLHALATPYCGYFFLLYIKMWHKMIFSSSFNILLIFNNFNIFSNCSLLPHIYDILVREERFVWRLTFFLLSSSSSCDEDDSRKCDNLNLTMSGRMSVWWIHFKWLSVVFMSKVRQQLKLHKSHKIPNLSTLYPFYCLLYSQQKKQNALPVEIRIFSTR